MIYPKFGPTRRHAKYTSRQSVRLSLEVLEPRQLLAGDVYLINFQPDGAFVPNRYLVDTGALFGPREENLAYGWSTDQSAGVFERSQHPDQRLDTLLVAGSGALWELALPNGNYEVTVAVGDPSQAATHHLNVEGAPLFAATVTAASQYAEATTTVTVSDGRLSLVVPAADGNAARLNYVQIIGVPSGPNAAPSPPQVLEPTFDGQVVNPSDVHMEAIGYQDSEGDLHVNTDWEIWTVDSAGVPLERVWATTGIPGVERYHTHLGDGIFVGSHAGRVDLQYSTGYTMQVRFRDSAGSVSEWSSRPFITGSATEAFPMSLEDIATSPAPTWKNGLAQNVILPPATVSPRLQLESPAGDLLLSISAAGGTANTVINPPALPGHAMVRVSVFGGSSGLRLAETDLVVADNQGSIRDIYLPALDVGAGEFAYLWVASDGSTYFGEADQTLPDFSNLARSSILGFVALEPGFRIEVAAEGLQLPVNIAFVPNPGPDPDDPQFYVTELYGQVKVVLNNGEVRDYATGLLNYNPTGNFPGSGEQGVAGLVVDPVSGDLFITRATDADGMEGGPHHGQVVRLHSTDEGRSSSGETVILDMVGETQGQSHQISDISIGPDGKLYVHNGDGFFAETALNLDSFRGKILRMNLDGTPASDNPLFNAADGISATDYIYAYGFRNPFGGAWRAADGMLYEVENGPGHNDRLARVELGGNYGWNGTEASMTVGASYVWVQPHAPVDLAFVQPETFGGSQFPSAYHDWAFATESGPTWAAGDVSFGKRIVRFQFDASGNLVEGPIPFVEYKGQGRATTAGITAGPDGLYFSELYPDTNMQDPTAPGARILRVRYVGVAGGSANFTADTRAGLDDLTVQFTDTSSIGGATSWEWDFGDGTQSTQQHPQHTYTSPGVYDVRLTVTGDDGSRTLVRNDYIVAGWLPTDTNQDGIIDEVEDVANLIAGWLTDTRGLTTLQALAAGDNNLDGLVDSADAFRLRRAIIDQHSGSGAAAPHIPGDYNGDGAVDTADYLVWKADYALPPGSSLRADGNGDGVIDTRDFLVWRNHVGQTASAAKLASAGEASSSPASVGVGATSSGQPEQPLGYFPSPAARRSAAGLSAPQSLDAPAPTAAPHFERQAMLREFSQLRGSSKQTEAVQPLASPPQEEARDRAFEELATGLEVVLTGQAPPKCVKLFQHIF